MNVAFVERLNASVANVAPTGEWRAKPFVTGAQADPHDDAAGPRFTVRLAAGGCCALGHVWYELSRVADQLLAQYCAHVQLCKCDC